MNKISFLTLLAGTLALAACSHKVVEVDQVGDKDKGCAALANDIVAMRMAMADIDEKTGFSGRNVGMGLLFWPGIIVNEMNGNKAETAASERMSKMVKLYEEKDCHGGFIEQAQAEANAAKAKAEAAKKATKADRHSDR